MRTDKLFRFAVGVTSLTLACLPMAEQVRAATEENITFDAALDCRKFNYNRGVPIDQIVRGDGFIASGKLFPTGTLPSGTQTNDPNAAGSVGTIIARGATTGSLAEHLADPTSPSLFMSFYLLLGDGMMISEGFLTPAGLMEAGVVGGTRNFRGASGEMSQQILGTNATGCPNIRVTIILDKKAPK